MKYSALCMIVAGVITLASIRDSLWNVSVVREVKAQRVVFGREDHSPFSRHNKYAEEEDGGCCDDDEGPEWGNDRKQGWKNKIAIRSCWCKCKAHLLDRVPSHRGRPTTRALGGPRFSGGAQFRLARDHQDIDRLGGARRGL